jgi:hypothetical protein
MVRARNRRSVERLFIMSDASHPLGGRQPSPLPPPHDPHDPMPDWCIRGLNAPLRSAPSDVAPAMWPRTPVKSGCDGANTRNGERRQSDPTETSAQPGAGSCPYHSGATGNGLSHCGPLRRASRSAAFPQRAAANGLRCRWPDCWRRSAVVSTAQKWALTPRQYTSRNSSSVDHRAGCN